MKDLRLVCAMSKCAHNRCSNVGPFGARFYKGRGEWVPYKLCSTCRERNASDYAKNKAKIRKRQAEPEKHARINATRRTPARRATANASTHLWKATPSGHETMQRIFAQRGAEINADPGLRIERTLTASIRCRLSGVRHGESVNISNYTDFSSYDDLMNHFKKEMKPGMTMENYGSFWSVAHKIPKVYYDFSDPDELRRCNSKANLGCDYETWDNPLSERPNSSKGSAMPSLDDLEAVGKASWPKVFGDHMSEEKRRSIPLQVLKRQRS